MQIPEEVSESSGKGEKEEPPEEAGQEPEGDDQIKIDDIV
jgi:hypothetical protein